MTKRKERSRRRLSLRRVLAAALFIALLVLLWQRWLPYQLYPTEYFDEIETAAAEAGIDPFLALAVAKVESNFRADAVSPAGAVGVMQLMPETAEWLAAQEGGDFSEDLLLDPEYNIRQGCRYLRELLEYWQWDVCLAVASYNAGQNRVAAWLDEGVWDGTAANAAQIPYAETRDYVGRILQVYEQYHKLY